MPERPPPRTPGRGLKGSLIAGAIGLLCAVIIWVATPYNNFILAGGGSPFIADDYLPIIAVFLVLLLVLGINPLLRLGRRGWALSGPQLAIIFGIMLVACVIPGQGLMRMLPYMIGRAPQYVSGDKLLAEQYQQMDLPPALFPDTIGLNARTPVSDAFINDLRPGETLPWRAWLGPLTSWGALLLFGWMMMIGMSLIVLPQWRHNERLAFPLLTVEQALIAEPEKDRLFAPLFTMRSFWAAGGVVFLLHFLNGAQIYHPESVPAVPLSWDLSQLFAADPWRHLHLHMRANQIHFIFVGIAFFMPNRISFSIWFTIFAYGLYRMIGYAYMPPFHHGSMADHRTGAMFALTIAVLWIGRAQWVRVFHSLFRRALDEQDRYLRRSGWLFVVGFAGIFAWLLWVGVSAGWALFLTFFAFMVALLVSRIVAETGMPFWRMHADATYLMKLVPTGWLTAISLYFSVVMTTLFAMGSRVSPATMATHGMALDDSASRTRQWRMGLVFLAVLVLGLLISGATHLHMSYNHSQNLLGTEHPISPWGTQRLVPAHDAVKDLARGQMGHPIYNAAGHIAFGAILAAVLYWLCLTFPTWPLHPVGLLLVSTPSYGEKAWVSILFGWLAKVLIVRFGGAALYRSARPVFLGVIMGEVIAAVFWAAAPAGMTLFGVPYRVVPILP